ncbi:DUF4839 domain-containing protein [Nocardioides sp. SYSU DS0651]|uniref:DUF4839 domain-containing protein n=1 Tax=Nocardioides sp. SYSU DS0651 TaxID=3415955 RepID=UPI003F4AFC9C
MKVVRGREAHKIAEMQAQGWELFSQSEGISLRRELRFRRVKKPISFGDRRLLAVIAAFFAVVIVGGFAVAALAGSEDDPSSSSPTTAGDATSQVERDAETESTEEPTTAAPSSGTPSPSEAPEDNPDQAITPRNNPDFAALLKGDYCDKAIARFADANAGRAVEFNGSIVNMLPVDGHDTRFDILVGPGNKGPMTSVGPAFKFADVSVLDLNLSGDVSDYVEPGQRYSFTAEVGEYDPDTCLFYLRPIETRSR